MEHNTHNSHHPHKTLYRSSTNKVFAGICGGLAEYFNMDPLIIRLIAIFFVAFTGFFPGVFVYIVAIFFIPVKQ
jgi:phage shock protein C